MKAKLKLWGLRIVLAPVAVLFWAYKELTTDSSGTWD